MRRTLGRPGRLDRDRIAEVAFSLADREGFAAVSMRRVAQELGAGTMTLYHYVRTKDELVALMDDRAMGQLLIPDQQLEGPWEEAFANILRQTYRMRLQHPWSLSGLQNAQLGRNALRHQEQTLRALRTAPFSDVAKVRLMAIADSYVDGHALHRAEISSRAEGDLVGDGLMEELAEGPYPRVRLLVGARHPTSPEAAGAWMDEAFELGLAALLDGLARRLDPPDPA